LRAVSAQSAERLSGDESAVHCPQYCTP
jgi:hypothetical protein